MTVWIFISAVPSSEIHTYDSNGTQVPLPVLRLCGAGAAAVREDRRGWWHWVRDDERGSSWRGGWLASARRRACHPGERAYPAECVLGHVWAAAGGGDRRSRVLVAITMP